MKNLNRKLLLSLTVTVGLFLLPSTTLAARTDMVDTSNHNVYMTGENFTSMRDEYSMKVILNKSS